MASIIEGYNYDIFISYRQKDNRHDGWVTEFVYNLRDELGSAFKEEISVYFDINPQDGLLETYDVDASLKDKLKCLIFIPIISRTYCDPKSFAWEHEFKAFVETASADRFGLKIKLPNGNVASRILPVKIHEVDTTDIRECEAVLGGIMRGIEFIYKEPGVNKPLSLYDDEKMNLNKTKYEIQINRTANAIREILSSLKTPDADSAHLQSNIDIDKKITKLKPNRLIISAYVIILTIALVLIFNPFKAEKEIRIAVIPLRNLARDTNAVDLSSGFTQDIINNLNTFQQLTVRSFISSSQFKERSRSTREIMKKLEVDYLVDGSFEASSDSIKLRLTMSDASDKQCWYRDPVINSKQFTSLAGSIAQDIVTFLNIEMTSGNRGNAERKSTENSEAYTYYITGESYYLKYSLSGNKELARAQYLKAIESDPSFAKAWAGVANCYADEFFFLNPDPDVLQKCKDAVDKAFEIDKDLPEAHLAMGNYYYALKNMDMSLMHFNTALKFQPKNTTALFWTALVYRRTGNYQKAISMMENAIKLEPSRADIYAELSNTYSRVRNYEMAEKCSLKAISLQPDFPDFPAIYTYMIIRWKGDKNKARRVIENYSRDYSKYVCYFDFILDSTFQKSIRNISRLPVEGIREFDIFRPRSLFYAQIFGLMKNRDAELAYYDSAKTYLEKELEKLPGNPSILSSLGLVYAGLGNYEKAIDFARRGYEPQPYIIDVLRGESGLTDLAFVYMKAGRFEDAFREIDFLLANPSEMTVKLLENDPKWADLTNQPGFRKLVEKYGSDD